jgi:hypothetical protein
MRKHLSVWLSVPLIVASVTAQAKPDFSGRWVLADAGDGGAAVAEELTVSTSTTTPVPTLMIERRLKSGVRSETYEIGVAGGTVGGIRPNVNGELIASPDRTEHSTKWDGNTLVIWRSSYSGPTRESGSYSEHHEVWSLDDHGRLVVVIYARSSTAAPTRMTLTYRRP